MIDIPNNKQLILFDGVCNLCNASVLYVIKRDTKHKFLFAPLQSAIGKQIIKKFNIDTEETDSILLYNPLKKKLSYKSTAALLVAKYLGFPINLLTVFLVLPSFLRNWVYNYIAKNRYKWYGKKEACMIPTPELNSKFLD
ncbi:thiol-disulfide oxidoreductase DCC family protein [Winogradskyella wichelsiae]|uniref:thiol-disulfide oxidoreductase DCC family protein n=1 Tax=Winogradskyella wichelsiae TaxID=2697007 RepID=UPI0015CE4C00|nr:DCC1-like thiol-disulfide oxidoreductase family protein [Winogradskyella wichelsiae]